MRQMEDNQTPCRTTQAKAARQTFTKIPFRIGLVLVPKAASAEAKDGPLFGNLTTDGTWVAATAIMFAHQKSRANGHDTAIWLNVRVVYLADKKCPSNISGLTAESRTSIQDMPTEFMADSGAVLTCQGCSCAAGLTLGCSRQM
jgi:hypothetical protein